MPVSVNVSPKQFYAKKILKLLNSILDMTGMSPEMVELEITETVLMEHLDTAVEILTIIRNKGIRISIDDFDTGYSSMKYLRVCQLM
ncbi:MAG: EAL domain-containing protein [Gammaproteobacteria bacterium]|nr:EAL domain-containing protein [Gammaproteobacteria bacterium]